MCQQLNYTKKEFIFQGIVVLINILGGDADEWTATECQLWHIRNLIERKVIKMNITNPNLDDYKISNHLEIRQKIVNLVLEGIMPILESIGTDYEVKSEITRENSCEISIKIK